MDFNRVKNVLMALAKESGLTDEDLGEYNSDLDKFEWNLDWNSDLNGSFERDIEMFKGGIDLYEDALANEDLLAAKAGLQDANIAAHNLMSFFDAFREDLTKIAIDPRFNWPKFPEDYKVPKHYRYKGS